MTPRQVWEGLAHKERMAAVKDREPRAGFVFRAVISRKTKSGFIEYQDGDGWSVVCLATKAMRLVPKGADT